MPGLRREELAARAGISAVYYARLEQGTSRNASPEVLVALSRALGLAGDEHRHLLDLATSVRDHDATSNAHEQLAPAIEQLLPALGDTPALVLDGALDVLAWNRAGHALTAQHLDILSVDIPQQRPNSAINAFLDPCTVALYPDWPRKARAVVGHLRMVAGRSPRIPRVAAVIAELCAESAVFAQLWDDHTVGTCAGDSYVIDHPVVGPLVVHQQTLAVLGTDQQLLVTYTPADAASASGFARLTADARR